MSTVGVRQNCTFLRIPFEISRIFAFLDDTGFRTTAPGRSTRRRYGFNDDVQRIFIQDISRDMA